MVNDRQTGAFAPEVQAGTPYRAGVDADVEITDRVVDAADTVDRTKADMFRKCLECCLVCSFCYKESG